jgi:F-box-like
MDKTEFTFFHLPTELQLHVLSYLSAEEWAKCALVCRHWRTLSADAHLWRHECTERSPVNTLCMRGQSWRTLFLERVRFRRCFLAVLEGTAKVCGCMLCVHGRECGFVHSICVFFMCILRVLCSVYV